MTAGETAGLGTGLRRLRTRRTGGGLGRFLRLAARLAAVLATTATVLSLASALIATATLVRPTAAMTLLQAGVDRAVIALWLGHETLNTVQNYLHANLKLKEQALAKTAPVGAKSSRYHPDDSLLAFLKNL